MFILVMTAIAHCTVSMYKVSRHALNHSLSLHCPIINFLYNQTKCACLHSIGVQLVKIFVAAVSGGAAVQ